MVIGLQMDPIFPKELLLEGPGKCVPADSFINIKRVQGDVCGSSLSCYTACSLLLEFYEALSCGPSIMGRVS